MKMLHLTRLSYSACCRVRVQFQVQQISAKNGHSVLLRHLLAHNGMNFLSLEQQDKQPTGAPHPQKQPGYFAASQQRHHAQCEYLSTTPTRTKTMEILRDASAFNKFAFDRSRDSLSSPKLSNGHVTRAAWSALTRESKDEWVKKARDHPAPTSTAITLADLERGNDPPMRLFSNGRAADESQTLPNGKPRALLCDFSHT
jgi:hypothetical protein